MSCDADLFLQKQIYEVRCADEGDNNPDGNAARISQITTNRIRQQQHPSSGQYGDWQEELVPWANQSFSDMRRHQTDEGDTSCYGDC